MDFYFLFRICWPNIRCVQNRKPRCPNCLMIFCFRKQHRVSRERSRKQNVCFKAKMRPAWNNHCVSEGKKYASLKTSYFYSHAGRYESCRTSKGCVEHRSVFDAPALAGMGGIGRNSLLSWEWDLGGGGVCTPHNSRQFYFRVRTIWYSDLGLFSCTA